MVCCWHVDVLLLMTVIAVYCIHTVYIILLWFVLINNVNVLYNSIFWWFNIINLYSISITVCYSLSPIFKCLLHIFWLIECGIQLDTLVIESFCLHSSLYFHNLGTSLLRLQFVGGGSKICGTTLTLSLTEIMFIPKYITIINNTGGKKVREIT